MTQHYCPTSIEKIIYSITQHLKIIKIIVSGDFVYITDNAYSQSQIREMEMDMLQVLRFDLGRPLPLHFLRRNSKAGQVDATIHTLAKYAMELTLVEYSFAHIPPSKLAASALAISLVVSLI